MSHGKVSEKSGNLNLDIEWQPCLGYTITKSSPMSLSAFWIKGDEPVTVTQAVISEPVAILPNRAHFCGT